MIDSDMPSTNSILVAIPAYNEDSTIGKLIKDISEITDNILVIDDGSSDETSNIASEMGIPVIKYDRAQGYGSTIKTAFIHAYYQDVDYLVTIEGDGRHSPEDIPKLISTQKETGAEIVIGSRSGQFDEQSFLRRAGFRLINFLTNRLLEQKIKDTQSNFRLYTTHAIKSIVEAADFSDDFEISTEILFHASINNLEIAETDVGYFAESDSSTRNRLLTNSITRQWTLILSQVALGILVVIFGLSGYIPGLIELSELFGVLLIFGIVLIFLSIIYERDQIRHMYLYRRSG